MARSNGARYQARRTGPAGPEHCPAKPIRFAVTETMQPIRRDGPTRVEPSLMVEGLLREVRRLQRLHHVVAVGDELAVLPVRPAIVGSGQRLVLGRGERLVVGLHD